MAGTMAAWNFYGAVTTPSRSTSRPRGKTIQLTPAHSPLPGADDDANGQLQPSIADVMKIVETQQKEIEKLRRLTEDQNEKMVTLAKTLEAAAQSRSTGPSDSRSKAVPKDALVSPLCCMIIIVKHAPLNKRIR